MHAFHRFLYAIAAAFCLLLAWAVCAQQGWVNAYLLPAPWTVWSSFVELGANGKLLQHTAISLQRVASGYLMAVGVALVVSVLMAASRRFARLVEPPLEFLRQIPPLALMPLAILWLGIDEAQKVSIIVLACFFPIYLGFRGGFAQVDPKLIEVGRMSGFSRWQLLRRIVLPGALPAVMVGLRLGLGYGWRALVGAELIASSSGLGYMILDAQDMARPEVVLVGILVIGSLGLLADWGLKRWVQWRFPWMRQNLELGHG